MMNTQLNEGKDQFVLRTCLRDKNAKMLGFLYNVQYQIVASEFDKKFVPFSEMKLIQQNERIKTQEVRRIFMAMSQKLHARIIRQDIQCDRALNKLETLWQTRKIELFHRYYFQKYLFSTYVQNMLVLIKHEDQLIRLQQHIYFSIHRAILAREASLNHISRQLKKLGPQDMYEHFNTVKERQIQKKRLIEKRQYKVHGYRVLYRLDEQEIHLEKTKMQFLSEDFNDYRKLTLHVIELISKWKEYIQSLTHDLKKRKQRMEFYYEEKNYILSLLNNTNFISHSFLNKFFIFSLRNDPFILRPILGIEGKQHQKGKLQFEEYQLKKLIQIREVQFGNIMLSIEFLFNELQTNIRNRKVYNTNAFNTAKSLSLEKLSQIKNQQKQLVKNNKLNLPFSRSQVLKMNIGSRQSSNSLTKSNVLVRKINNQVSTKPFYTNNVLTSNNPENKNPFKILNSEELKSIKQQVYKKVKLQLQFQTKRQLLKSKRFEQLIDLQVKASFDDILSKQAKQQYESALEVTPLSFAEQEIGSYLSQISKSIPLSCMNMQKKIQELSKIINEVEYCYILRVHNAKEQVGNVIAAINYQNRQYKQIKVLFVSFRFVQMLQKILLKSVQFLWKYQNAKEISFQFIHSSTQVHTLLQELRNRLSSYSAVVDIKNKKQTISIFRFFQKANSQNKHYNPYPLKIHFKLHSSLIIQKVKLDSNVQNQEQFLYYDYLIMQMLRQFTSSQDFLILRDTFRPKQRFRQLLILLMKLQQNKTNEIQLTNLSAQNISDLNYQLMKLKKPLFEFQDLIKINNIKSLLFEFTLSLAYPLKLMYTIEPALYHRYHINGTIDMYIDDQQTEFLMLDVHESHHYKIMLFDASKYVRKINKTISMYLYQILEKKHTSKKNVANLWVQMVRYPSTTTQQQNHYIKTFASYQFESINKQVFIADYFDWFTDIHLQNGVNFQRLKEDVSIRRPFGVGLVTNNDSIIYCRVFD